MDTGIRIRDYAGLAKSYGAAHGFVLRGHAIYAVNDPVPYCRGWQAFYFMRRAEIDAWARRTRRQAQG